MRWTVLALAGALLLSAARPAHAQESSELSEPSPRRQEAKRLRDLGAAAVQRGDYAAALEHFTRAYEQVPSMNLRFNIGVALDGLGRSAEAVRAFEEYLAQAPNPSEQARTFVRLRLAALAPRVARLHVATVPADAVVEVDGQRLSRLTADGLPIEAGEHTVVATKAGYTSTSEHVVAIAGEQCDAALTLEPVPSPTVPAPSQAVLAPTEAPAITLVQARPAAPQRERTPLARRWWVWTAAAGVAVIGTAITVGVLVGRPAERVYHRDVP